MPLNNLLLTKNYAALQIYRQVHIDIPYAEIEQWTIDTNLNLTQVALDVFGPGYIYTNDGVPQFATPLIDNAAILSENETVTGSWTFDDTVQFNQPVFSVSTFSSDGQPRARAFLDNADQLVADNLETDVIMQSEVYDIGNMHDLVVNQQRLTVPGGGAGSYIVSAQITFAPSNVGRRELIIRKNGNIVAVDKEFGPDAVVDTVLNHTFQDEAGPGDFYEIKVYQNSGGALAVRDGNSATYFTAMKVW